MKKTIYILFALVMLFGCQDQLDLTDPNQMTTESYWSTEDQATAALVAAYQELIMEGCYMHFTQVLTDGRGDDIYAVSPWLNYQWASNFTLGDHSDDPMMQRYIWEEYYIMIWRINQVLENVPAIEMDEDLQERIIGQAYFLRGLAYFNLAKLFKEVPLVLKTPEDSDDYYPSTDTEEDIYSQIISDLKEAQTRLPVSYDDVTGSDKGETGRATLGAATGLLGKVYLYSEEYQLAIDEFEKLISGPINIYSLVEDYQDNFTILNENNSESIFEAQFATTDEVGGTDCNWHGEPNANFKQVCAVACNYSNKGWTDFLPTDWFVEEFKKEKTIDGKTDPRYYATIASYDAEAGDTIYYEETMDTAALYIRKYTNDGTAGYTTELNGSDPISGINYRILRYADVLLMYAECKNELNDRATCAEYIQIVRDRAELPDRETEFAAMSQEEMRDQIAHERLLEFGIEMQRIDDIIRWGWLSDSDKLAELQSHDSEFDTYLTGREYLPIPQTELDMNQNLSPNSAN